MPTKAIDAIVSLYVDHRLTGEEIAQQIGCSANTVYPILRQAEVVRPISEAKRLYQYDQSFFAHIDSHEKAQVLGLWYSDGCVWSGRQKGASISLAKPDVNYLDRVRTAFKHEAPLRLEPSRKVNHMDQYRINLHGKEVCGDLTRLGCTPRKSLTLQFPTSDQVPDEFLSSFMLGYFEGDGWIEIRRPCGRNRTHQSSMGIVGTRQFCERYLGILRERCDVGGSIRHMKHHHANTLVMTIGGVRQVVQIANFFYPQCAFRMERKWVRFQQVCQFVDQKDQTHKETLVLMGT